MVQHSHLSDFPPYRPQLVEQQSRTDASLRSLSGTTPHGSEIRIRCGTWRGSASLRSAGSFHSKTKTGTLPGYYLIWL